MDFRYCIAKLQYELGKLMVKHERKVVIVVALITTIAVSYLLNKVS